MSRTEWVQATRPRRVLWLVALALPLLLLGALRWLAGPAPVLAAEVALPAAPAAAPAALPQTPADAASDQRAAQEAAARAAGQPPAWRPIDGRPDFVSAMEWQVLTALARQKGDYDRELARLVNSLRFNKQLETWRATATPKEGRRVLGEQLLDELPERVRQGDYGRPAAEALQRELLQALEPDPAARAARVAAEAERLQVPVLQDGDGVVR